MKIKINVKEKHIINGTCGMPSDCAIAQAVKDVFPCASVCYESIALISARNGVSNIIKDDEEMPLMAKEKMYVFDSLKRKRRWFKSRGVVGKDRLKYLKPFSFILDIDEEKVFPEKHLEEIKNIFKESKNIEYATDNNHRV